MPRHPTPKLLLDYQQWVEHGPPRMCHTCEHYDAYGMCQQFGMEPPEDFAATPDACDEYVQDIPF